MAASRRRYSYFARLKSKKMGFSLLLSTAYGAFIVTYLYLVSVDKSLLYQLAEEDGIIEFAGAGFFLVSSLAFLFLYLNSKNRHNIFLGKDIKRNVYFGLLALLFFVCFAEEISWGQRIFEWGTPPILESLNAQKEVNLHNLWLFHAKNPDGSKKSFMGLLLNMSRLFSIFLLFFCVVIPAINYFSAKTKLFLKYVGIPISSFGVGGLFIVNYIAFRVAIIDLDVKSISSLNELKEANYAAAVTILAIYFITKQRKNLVN